MSSEKNEQRRAPRDTVGGQSVRTFEIVQYVTGFLEGELKDWPAQIQDAVYTALEKKAKEVELPLMVVFSKCDYDIDEAEGRGYFVHIVASEIVVKASDLHRYATEEERMKAAFLATLKGQGNA